jgi:alkanesulfonate monooxygenase SsuD/methylene tetrahydromethanopterin reductase-like flavin-dependent oxidoreductase (luciferase family)
MAVGIIVPLPAYTLNPAFIARKAEALGFESIWYHEHPILPVDSASPFPATGGEIPWTYRHGPTATDLPPLLRALYFVGHGCRGHQ